MSGDSNRAVMLGDVLAAIEVARNCHAESRWAIDMLNLIDEKVRSLPTAQPAPLGQVETLRRVRDVVSCMPGNAAVRFALARIDHMIEEAERAAPTAEGPRPCDECDWTFGCFNGSAPCRKKTPVKLVEEPPAPAAEVAPPAAHQEQACTAHPQSPSAIGSIGSAVFASTDGDASAPGPSTSAKSSTTEAPEPATEVATLLADMQASADAGDQRGAPYASLLRRAATALRASEAAHVRHLAQLQAVDDEGRTRLDVAELRTALEAAEARARELDGLRVAFDVNGVPQAKQYPAEEQATSAALGARVGLLVKERDAARARIAELEAQLREQHDEMQDSIERDDATPLPALGAETLQGLSCVYEQAWNAKAGEDYAAKMTAGVEAVARRVLGAVREALEARLDKLQSVVPAGWLTRSDNPAALVKLQEVRAVLSAALGEVVAVEGRRAEEPKLESDDFKFTSEHAIMWADKVYRESDSFTGAALQAAAKAIATCEERLRALEGGR